MGNMPERIWAMKTGIGYGDYVVPKMGTERTQYTRTDLAQSLADALEKIASNEAFTGNPKDTTGEVFARQDIAKAALDNYRKGE